MSVLAHPERADARSGPGVGRDGEAPLWGLEDHHVLDPGIRDPLPQVREEPTDRGDLHDLILTEHPAEIASGHNVLVEDLQFDHEDRGTITLYRLREGIERFFVSDINNPASGAKAQSEIAVMYDSAAETVTQPSDWGDTYNLYNHVPGGGNVLYMDGHV